MSMKVNIHIPPGLPELLQEFTVDVLKKNPKDLIQHAAHYFTELNESKIGGSKNVKFVSSSAAPSSSNNTDPNHEDDEDSDFDEPEPPQRSAYNRRCSVAAESFDPEKIEDSDFEKVVHPKTDKQRQRLNEAVKNILLFKCLDEEQMHDVLDSMYEVTIQPGTNVIEQGDDGDNFYVIESGKYDIFVSKDSTPQKVGQYDNQGSFGELALMYNTPRAATITATTEGILWAMGRETFRRIILVKAFQKRAVYEKLINSLELLGQLNAYERMNVADALRDRTYEDNECIIAQGDEGSEMYFIQSGLVKITKRGEDGVETEMNRLTEGYFGEWALISHQTRAASAYAVGKVKLAVLDVGSFERLMGPCLEIMSRNIEMYEKQIKAVFGDVKPNSADMRK